MHDTLLLAPFEHAPPNLRWLSNWRLIIFALTLFASRDSLCPFSFFSRFTQSPSTSPSPGPAAVMLWWIHHWNVNRKNLLIINMVDDDYDVKLTMINHWNKKGWIVDQSVYYIIKPESWQVDTWLRRICHFTISQLNEKWRNNYLKKFVKLNLWLGFWLKSPPKKG